MHRNIKVRLSPKNGLPLVIFVSPILLEVEILKFRCCFSCWVAQWRRFWHFVLTCMSAGLTSKCAGWKQQGSKSSLENSTAPRRGITDLWFSCLLYSCAIVTCVDVYSWPFCCVLSWRITPACFWLEISVLLRFTYCCWNEWDDNAVVLISLNIMGRVSKESFK